MTRRSRGARHGNWVSGRVLAIPATLSVVSALLAYFWPYLLTLTGILLGVLAYFLYARWLFSPQGRNVQQKVRSLVLEHLDWDGRGEALDIGCGSGALTIDLAAKYPESSVLGTDYWANLWGYSLDVCRRNAAEQGVAGRVAFQRASASSLPFDDERFDVVVSNLVFHEVKGSFDKVPLVTEALRVLKRGGSFVFQDLFAIQKYYGTTEHLVEAVRKSGVEQVEYLDTRRMSFVPAALKLPFMLGTLGMLKGQK